MPSVNEVNNYYNKSLSIVKKSAEIMIDGFSKKKETLTKAVDWDFVTEFDKKVEDNLIQQLLREFPEHKIIAEESQSGAELTSDPTWIIDPIDGTTNFMHGYPQSCISVALTINKELVIGIVYNPIMNQMFTAKKGQGAFLNGQPIRASKTEDLSKSLLALELSHGRHPSRHNQMMKSFDACVSVAHGSDSWELSFNSVLCSNGRFGCILCQLLEQLGYCSRSSHSQRSRRHCNFHQRR